MSVNAVQGNIECFLCDLSETNGLCGQNASIIKLMYLVLTSTRLNIRCEQPQDNF
jgi:hypothetical protein